MIKQFIKGGNGDMFFIDDADIRVDMKGLASFDVVDGAVIATAVLGQEVIAAASMTKFANALGSAHNMTVTFEVRGVPNAG